jgi:CheY-like chemotaxis protein
VKTILVVDDDPTVGTALRRALERLGHQALVTQGAAECLVALRQHRIDIVITDVWMPGQDGVELIAAIAREFPLVRIVAMSGGGGAGATHFRPGSLATVASLAAARGAGAHSTLAKPFQTRDLLLEVGCRVLVVDDEPDIQLALSRVLGKVGYTASTASNGAEGLERLRAEGAEVLITDIVMPHVNGVALIRAVASEMPQVRIIAISGGGIHGASLHPDSAPATSAYLSAARDAGAHTILTKPFGVHDILAALGHSASPV